MRLNFAANRGVAYANGRVFVATFDGRMIGLDAKTGKELWSAQAIAPGSTYFSTGAPLAFGDKVMIGNGGGDFGSRGYVTAFDQATGKQAWRFYTVPGSPEENKGDPAMEAAAKTWSGEYWKTGTGGTVWNGMTFDPELNRIYIGTGNGGPYDSKLRSPGGGDNLYLASIVALDADTGKYIWHYQENPGESWDYKATPNIIAATIEIDGKPRKVLMHAPTNGFFYVLDRITGKVISAEKTGRVTWAKGIDLKTGRPIEEPNIRYETGLTEMWPSSIGGHNWQAMSFSPRTGLVYIPVQQIGTRFERVKGAGQKQGDNAFNVMGLLVQPVTRFAEDGKGKLLAWDPVAQKLRWSAQLDHLWNGGVLSTAGDLVFQGAADGRFSAYDARSGKRLWEFDAGLGIIAAPMSYSVGGKQYVSILVGYGGSAASQGSAAHVGWKYGAQARRLLTFALDGDAKLPPSPPRDMTVHALDDPALVLNEADVEAGRALSIRCAACHGVGLQSPGAPGPDLRESAIALDPAAFKELLKSGAMMEQGMPRFEMLTDQEIAQLYAFIRARAREANGTRKPSSTAAPARM